MHTRKLLQLLFVVTAGLVMTAVLILVLARPVSADATILYAKPDGMVTGLCESWSDACDLQYALTSAISGTEIWVAHGVYTPGLYITSTFQLKSGGALYGGFAMTETMRDQRNWQANLTVLSGDIDGNDTTDPNGVVTDTNKIHGNNAYHVLNGNGTNASAIVNGFIATAGNAISSSQYDDQLGGGMLIRPSGSPTIQNISFIGNHANGYGGGFYNEGNPALSHVVFKNNTCNISGGGLWTQGNPLITDVDFIGNQAVSGAGMYIQGDYNHVTINKARFIGNRATSTTYYTNGGGIYVNMGGSLDLTNAIFSGNTSTWYGGGMMIWIGDVHLTNVLFSGNWAGTYGGGLRIAQVTPVLTNVTLSGNLSYCGGGIELYSGGVDLTNSILWGNYAPIGSQICIESGQMNATFSDIKGGFTGEGNIDADPIFTAPITATVAPTTTGDYHLLAASPAIDTGSNAAVAEPLDLDGNPRISGSIVDMGPYEYPQLGLQASKQASADSILAGRQLTYTLWVTNTGFIDLNLLITDTLPVQVTPGGVITWTGFITSPGGVWVQPLVVTVTEGYSGTLTNLLEVTSLEGPQGTYSLTTHAHTGYQTITFNPLPDKMIGDPPFVITATASSGLPVTFTTTSPTCSVVGNVVTLNAGGSCAITAHQPGNANYYPAPDVTRSFTIGKMDQTITFDPLPDRTYGDQFFVLVATATSGLRVSFTTTSTACQVSEYIHDVGYTVIFLSAGQCMVDAHQAGNETYNPAPDVSRSFTILKANQTITFDPLPNRTYGDPEFVLTATASSGLQVNFYFSTLICSGRYDPDVGELLTILHAGTCWVRANQPGDANYNPAPDVLRGFAIAKASQTITFAPIPDWDPNVSWMELSATTSSGLPVSYVVKKKSSNWPDACSVMNGDILINKNVGYGGGLCTIEAQQPGTQDYLPAGSVVRSFIIKRAIRLTISLHNVPSDHAPYDEIFRYLADGVYEESNGTQYLAAVHIYQNWQYSDFADILWYASTWPCAYISAYGTMGYAGHIEMTDLFNGYDFLTHPQAGGYTLAHELGHYLYGLYDEYAADYDTDAPNQPHEYDWPVYHSIMNDQWKALTGDYGWLNFSVPRWVYSGRYTAQARMFQSSGLTTLSRPPWDDPIVWFSGAGYYAVYGKPERIFMPELTSLVPTGTQDAPLELPSTPTTITRKWLVIIWHNTAGVLAQGPDSGLPFTASVAPLGGNTLSYPEPVVLIAKVQQEQLIARAGLNVTLASPDGSASSLSLNDDGIEPDWQADDGQYTGFMPYNQNGVYTVTASFDNQASTAWFTEIGAMHSIGPNGETWVPTTQPVGENFNISASTQITITNWASDDHGDTPATASLLLPDNFYLWGRIDRPGDRDVLQVTAEVTGTLVLRVNRLALGMQPHIRVLAADGVTVLRSADFPPQGNPYYFTVFEALAGETYYIEVSHQDGSAVGGLYTVSAGDPLENSIEQAHWVYLPVIKR